MLIELIIMLSDVTWRYHGNVLSTNGGRWIKRKGMWAMLYKWTGPHSADN